MKMQKKWWMEAIGYQIYPKSFYDSNNDGIGDLKGITMKLDYLKELGVNMLWLCPFYKSPMDDNGYDVSDYYQIDPMFGSMEDMKELIDEVHKRDMHIVADLVLNHTSDEHPWFMEARKSVDNPYRDYYIWQKPKVNEKGEEVEPTNWASFFGGSAWRKDEVTGEYFMKIFSNKMPDLNWRNEELRKEMYKMTNWWLDLGIDGFRVDAVAHIERAPFEDSEPESNEKYVGDWAKFSNLPKVHDYLKELNKETFGKHDVMTVGEVGGGATPEDALKYAGYDSNEFNMVFNFDHNWCNNTFEIGSIDEIETNLKQLKETFSKWQNGLYGKGWNPLYWLNHDHPRVVSMYGNTDEYHRESATMLPTALYFMWGTPFIYQGEEIGMTNYTFTKYGELNDVANRHRYEEEVLKGHEPEDKFYAYMGVRSRDNSRTMMQWDDSEYAGFSKEKPWYVVNENYKTINVKDQLADENSILNYYKKVNHLRRDSEYKDLIVYGTYKQLRMSHKHAYAYIREHEGRKLLVVTNFFKEPTRISILGHKVKSVVLSNYDEPKTRLWNLKLRPFEAIVFEI
jgi:glycosidase